MKKSIVQADQGSCFLCGRNGSTDHLEKHHIFGASNRKHSEEDGLYVFLCGERCHRNGKASAHRSGYVMNTLHSLGQKAYEREIGTREEFVERYGRNYIRDERPFEEYMNSPEKGGKQ